jgi:peroxiredoxin
MLPLGTEAPPFSLPDPASGTSVGLDDFADSPVLLVIFMCNHCPYVKHLADRIGVVTSDYLDKGVAVVAIQSNDVDAYPDDAPDRMVAEKRQRGYRFPYLYDESQEVAKAYRAACTPDFFVFDRARRLAYRGQFDDSRPSLDLPVTGADLTAAIDALLAGEPPPVDQTPSLGCNIKWKPGNEPHYFA